MITVGFVSWAIVAILSSILLALYLFDSIHMMDENIYYLARLWMVLNRPRTELVNNLRRQGKRFFFSFIPWETFILYDRKEHSMDCELPELYVGKKTIGGVEYDDMILDKLDLTIYFLYPDEYEMLERLYIRGGFQTPKNGSMFGDGDVENISKFCFPFISGEVRSIAKNYCYQEFHGDGLSIAKEIEFALNKPFGIFDVIGVKVMLVAISQPDLPKAVDEVIHAGVIAKQKGEADVIAAQAKSEANEIIYKVDEQHLPVAVLNALHDKDKIIITGGVNSLIADVLKSTSKK